jgi:hypothetical protein
MITLTSFRNFARDTMPYIADVRQTAIQNAVTVESMVWNVLSLALNAEEIHVATFLHVKIRTLIQTNS